MAWAIHEHEHDLPKHHRRFHSRSKYRLNVPGLRLQHLLGRGRSSLYRLPRRARARAASSTHLSEVLRLSRSRRTRCRHTLSL